MLHLFRILPISSFFFFNDTATTEIYTLSLHDALPISGAGKGNAVSSAGSPAGLDIRASWAAHRCAKIRAAIKKKKRSEEHTSELQSQSNLVCRLLLEKKKKKISINMLA